MVREADLEDVVLVRSEGELALEIAELLTLVQRVTARVRDLQNDVNQAEFSFL